MRRQRLPWTRIYLGLSRTRRSASLPAFGHAMGLDFGKRSSEPVAGRDDLPVVRACLNAIYIEAMRRQRLPWTRIYLAYRGRAGAHPYRRLGMQWVWILGSD